MQKPYSLFLSDYYDYVHYCYYYYYYCRCFHRDVACGIQLCMLSGSRDTLWPQHLHPSSLQLVVGSTVKRRSGFGSPRDRCGPERKSRCCDVCPVVTQTSIRHFKPARTASHEVGVTYSTTVFVSAGILLKTRRRKTYQQQQLNQRAS